MIEILVPIVFFLVMGAVVVTAFILQYQKRRVESNEIIAAIEKGVEIKFPEKKKASRLLPGLIWTLVGLVFTVALAAVIPPEAPRGIWIWGLIPMAVGIAYLVVYRIEKQEEDTKGA